MNSGEDLNSSIEFRQNYSEFNKPILFCHQIFSTIKNINKSLFSREDYRKQKGRKIT